MQLLDYAKTNKYSWNDIAKICKELTARGVRKLSVQQIKAMLSGNISQDPEIEMATDITAFDSRTAQIGEETIPVGETYKNIFLEAMKNRVKL